MSTLNDRTYCENSIKLFLRNCLTLIRLYDWLLDFYVVDYFVDDHWNRLPTSWKESLIHIDPQVLGKIILGHQTKHLLPLSLLALLTTAKVYRITRKPINNLAKEFPHCQEKISKPPTQKEEVQGNNIAESENNIVEIANNIAENENNFKTHPKLKNLFLKHVKLKKRHEINEMAEVVAEVASKSSSKAVIDFGSGLGHLVRILSYKHGLSAFGIESQEKLSKDARKLDKELEYTAKKYLTEAFLSTTPTPYHLNLTLSSPNQLENLTIPQHLKSNYGLIGLHPCGDLGPLLIKHFVESSEVRFICVVGCCYMKLTCEEGVGYPLSGYLRGMEWRLSYQSREIACHAIEVYCERLCDGNYGDLKIHAYRGVLEKLLVELDPGLKHSPVRSIKHSDNMDFQEYSSLATERLHVQIPWSDAVGSRVETMLAQWKRVVVVYTLRLLLAPVVETVILLDRVLFILEHGVYTIMTLLFQKLNQPRVINGYYFLYLYGFF